MKSFHWKSSDYFGLSLLSQSGKFTICSKGCHRRRCHFAQYEASAEIKIQDVVNKVTLDLNPFCQLTSRQLTDTADNLFGKPYGLSYQGNP